MLRREDNERLTRTGPGTVCGNLMRRYWIPALLSSELPDPDCAPVRIRLLSEDLVAFRMTDGAVGLVDEKCPHRGASLFFGRNEDCGIRCIYHGWKFDRDGKCLETPNEPEESRIGAQVRLRAYPCVEAGGVVWTYMGPPDKKPPFQSQEWTRAPEGARFVIKNLAESNYLQMMEGGFDSSHSSFLHRTMDLERDGGKTWTYRIQARAPKLDVQITDFGYAYASLRDLEKTDEHYVRVVQYIMPFHQFRAIDDAARRSMVHGHIWVPIDDENCWVWSWMYAKDGKDLTPDFIEKTERIGGRSSEFFVPGTFRMKQNRGNDYLIDREEQRTRSFTGIKGIGPQDQAAQESMGRIADRTIEHLGMSDVAVVHLRRLLMQACQDIEEGREPRGSLLPSINVRPVEKVLKKSETWHVALQSDMTAVL